MSDQPTEKHEPEIEVIAPCICPKDLFGHLPRCPYSKRISRFALSGRCDNGNHSDCPYPDKCKCSCHKKANRADVHDQPSAVQAPEQATPRPWVLDHSGSFIHIHAEHPSSAIGNQHNPIASVLHYSSDNYRQSTANAELIVLAVNNFEAQAVRIRELEDALKVIRKDAAVIKRALWAEEVSSAAILHDIDRTDSASSAAGRIRLLIAATLKPEESQ